MDVVYIKIIKILSVRCHFRPIFQGLKNGRFFGLFSGRFLGLIFRPDFQALFSGLIFGGLIFRPYFRPIFRPYFRHLKKRPFLRHCQQTSIFAIYINVHFWANKKKLLFYKKYLFCKMVFFSIC